MKSVNKGQLNLNNRFNSTKNPRKQFKLREQHRNETNQ